MAFLFGDRKLLFGELVADVAASTDSNQISASKPRRCSSVARVVSAVILRYTSWRQAGCASFLVRVRRKRPEDDSGIAQTLVESFFNHTVDNEDGTERRNLGHPMG